MGGKRGKKKKGKPVVMTQQEFEYQQSKAQPEKNEESTNEWFQGKFAVSLSRVEKEIFQSEQDKKQ